MIGHPSGDEPLMVDVRQSGSGSYRPQPSGTPARLFAAFDLAILWNKDMGQATITDAT
jgi:hypothetical protein